MIAHVDNASTAFIGNVGASVTPIVVSYGTCLARVKLRYVPLDMDVFPIDNSKTKKEGVGYTYKGFDGYAPMAAYLGTEGWCLACELRPGSQHGQKEFIHFLERVVPRAKSLTPPRLLARLDSGHDVVDRVGMALATPPSEPCGRFSRTRLSSRWFLHRDRLAACQAA